MSSTVAALSMSVCRFLARGKMFFDIDSGTQTPVSLLNLRVVVVGFPVVAHKVRDGIELRFLNVREIARIHWLRLGRDQLARARRISLGGRPAPVFRTSATHQEFDLFSLGEIHSRFPLRSNLPLALRDVMRSRIRA